MRQEQIWSNLGEEALRTGQGHHVRSSSAICRTGLVQLDGWPSWSLGRSSSTDGRDGRVVDPARPSAELDWSSLADGQAGRVVDPARPSVEPDWISSSNGWAGLFVFSFGAHLSLKLMLRNVCRECVEKASVRKGDFRRWFRDNRFWPHHGVIFLEDLSCKCFSELLRNSI